MTTISEIEAAIKQLPPSQVDELAEWLETLRLSRSTPAAVENWLQHSRGVARHGTTTAAVMSATRSD